MIVRRKKKDKCSEDRELKEPLDIMSFADNQVTAMLQKNE
jgi:hypothetical protein